MADYIPQQLEAKWQAYWQQNSTFKSDIDTNRPKYYVLDMFPYPSGAGLHVGHPLGYIASDIVARYKRQKGYNVLHPMGFDSFGLPAEQYAIQTGQHPEKTTRENIARYQEQLKQLGFSYDWDREVRTSDPSYYRFTQWIFGLLFNSWYNRRTESAEPIETLKAHLAGFGTDDLDAVADDDATILTSDAWSALDAGGQEAILQQYRLAYKSYSTVNWCPALGTVLANDEVKDGVSERGGYPVERKVMQQWSMRITAYASRLLSGLDTLDWTDSIKEMQRNWIGRSQGCSLRFDVVGTDGNPTGQQIEVFTTRVDTTFGVTFLSLAPESELAAALITPAQAEASNAYIDAAKNRSERDRMSDVKTISGVFTGSYARNPFNGAMIPIWIADYVLAGYGTGAVMAVPSSDTRDYAFAKHFDLPIIQVQTGPQTDISQSDFDPKAGIMINSGFLDGLTVPEAITAAIAYVEQQGWGKGKINYRLRNAIFSRQRYWGEPIPVYFEGEIPHLIPDAELPLVLPEVDAYLPTETGEPPLGRAKDWHYKSPDQPIETNTMPGWAGSSWYFLRYMDPQNQAVFADRAKIDYWQQVDLYIGGAEHATGHLLYSRFWTKFLYDLGYIGFDEPFKKLVNQGMIQGTSELASVFINPASEANGLPKYYLLSADVDQETWLAAQAIPLTAMSIHLDVNIVSNGVLDLAQFVAWRTDYLQAQFVVPAGYYQAGQFTETNLGAKMEFRTRQEVEKMSKSKYNVVNPDLIINRYGADTLRMYEMFLGPLEQTKPWNTNGIEGTYKFLRRYWRLFFDDAGKLVVTEAEPSPEELKVLHRTIKKIGDDIERLSFNTCVSTLMVALNDLQALKCNKRAILEPLTIVLSSLAPHISEELWSAFGHTSSITFATYPTFNEAYLVESSFDCPISINGKTKANLQLAIGLSAADVESIVLGNEQVQKYLDGKPPKKIIVVPNRIVNIVV